eukprot:scaffold24920_cov117-Cylindrotheca_fusiformis.AAC.2
MEWYRLILNNPSHGQAKKGVHPLPPSTRIEDSSAIASLAAPPSIPHALRDAVSPLSTSTGQSGILGDPFSDPFVVQAYVEIMAKRSWDNAGATEGTTQAEERQELLPAMQTDANDDFKSDFDGQRYPHGNCDNKKWNELFDHLAAFKEEHGHCRVPQHYVPNIHLSQWVKRQRYYRKHRPGHFTESRIQKLHQLGFVWDAQEDFWNTRFEELKAYKLTHGHCNVPCKYSANQKLATWVKCQRRQYKLRTLGKSSSMAEERICLLEKLGFSWKIRGPDVDRQSIGR